MAVDYADINLHQVEEKIRICFDMADDFFKTPFNRPIFNFSQRGRAAGTAHLQKNEIRLNRYMYEQDPDEFLKTVVPHEVAHIIVYQIYGGTVRPHGKEWQAVMKKVFQLPPNRTHNFEVAPPKVYFEYVCSCQKHQFTKRRHTKVQNGVEYVCKLCKTTLKPIF